MTCYVIYCYVNYRLSKIRARVEEGRRRIARPVSVRGPPAPWLRTPQADRDALGRRAEIQRRLALSTVIPPGKARLDRRPLGGEGRGTAAAFLQTDERRQEGVGGATRHLGVVRGRHQSRNEARKCLNGNQRSDGGFRTCSSRRRARRQLLRNSRSTLTNATRSWWPAERPNRKPRARRWR